jgi:CheY-like chemotaxis protein
VIFVVDDDPRIRLATASALRGLGHDVTEFDNGPAALAAMAASVPDLLVTDVLMPDMRGTELAARAKAKHGLNRIVFMSGDIGDTASDAFDGHELLAKPFTALDLKAAVARALT